MVQILPPQRLVYFFFPLPQKGKSSASSGWGGVTVPYRNQGGVPPVDRHVGYRHPRPISRRVQISFRNAAQTFGHYDQDGTCFLGISCQKKCILYTRIRLTNHFRLPSTTPENVNLPNHTPGRCKCSLIRRLSTLSNLERQHCQNEIHDYFCVKKKGAGVARRLLQHALSHAH